MSDKELIHRILQGEETAFRLLITQHQKMVLRTALGFLHSKEDAEDISQEVFIKIYDSLTHFKQTSTLATWIYRITINLCITKLNKQKKSPFIYHTQESESTHLEHHTTSHTPESLLEQQQLNHSIRLAIHSLPEKQKTAFILSKYEDLPQKEIAAIMETSEGAVEQLLLRAKLQLQKKLSHIVGK